MAVTDQAATTTARPTTFQPKQNWGLLLPIAALVVILWPPTPEALLVAGHRMLAILVFAVIIWMTKAVDYAVSAVVIAALIAFIPGFGVRAFMPANTYRSNT